MRILYVAALAALLGGLVIGAAAQDDWPSHGRDPGGLRYSPLKQINTGNVAQLETAWTYHTVPPAGEGPGRGTTPVGAAEDAAAAASQGGGRGGAAPRARQSSSTPLVVDGVMYLSTAYNRVVALDPETGREIWVKEQPPWGELLAVNVNTGDRAWRVILGSFEELDKLGVPPTGTPVRGGPIATAGGLVFIASSVDARFRAFDARTGKVRWTADLTENGRTVPMTYQGKSGKQYVAIMAGRGPGRGSDGRSEGAGRPPACLCAPRRQSKA